MQLAMAAGFDRVFEVGPVFRAEASVTNRHATEFTCMDIEVSWVKSHEELMCLEEELLHDVLSAVQKEHGDAIERHFGLPVEIPRLPIPRIPFSAARTIGGASSTENGRLTHRAEEEVTRHARELYGQSFAFVTDYPADQRPFYTMRHHTEPIGETVATRSFDLLWRGIEVSSGCQREHRYDVLQSQAESVRADSPEMNSYLESYYLQMFRHGCPPHGGFGIGINRFLMLLLGQPAIRETTFVFRGPGRFVP